MRVLLYGNQDNVCFQLGKWLRAKGIEATLFLPSYIYHDRSKPEWKDPSLLNNYPSWVRKFGQGYPTVLHKLHKRLIGYGWGFFFPGRNVVNTSRESDVLVTSGYFVVSAPLMSKPVVFLPTGADITEAPFAADGVQTALTAYLYRKRIKQASRILTAQEDTIWAAKLLKVARRVALYPYLVDVKEIVQSTDQGLLANLESRYHQFDWIFFHPPRIVIDPDEVDYKGNEKFLQAFAQLIRANPSLKIKAVIGMHGDHKQKFSEMIAQLELVEHCDVVGHLPLPELHAYMSLKNVAVFDQFGTVTRHSLGGIGREALSLGAILVMATDIGSPPFVTAYGPGCPLFPAFETKEIADVMQRIVSLSPEENHVLREEAKTWAYQYLHWENRIDEFIAILEDAVREARADSQ